MKSKLALSFTVLAATAFVIAGRVQSQPPEVERVPKASLGLNGYMAYVVDSVQPGSPAEKAGLKQYDLVTSINSRTIGSAKDLTEAMLRVEPGQPVVVTFMRYNPDKHTFDLYKETVAAGRRP